MHIQYFHKHLKTIFSQLNLDESVLRSSFKSFKILANNHLLNPGDTPEYLYFIEQGVLRTYLPTNNVIEDTIAFNGINSFIVPSGHFFHQTPSVAGIICENEVKGVKIHYPIWKSLIKEHPYLNQLVMQDLIIDLNRTLVNNRKSNAKERFIALTLSHPEVFYVVRQKHVANFLGVSQPYYNGLKTLYLKKGNTLPQ